MSITNEGVKIKVVNDIDKLRCEACLEKGTLIIKYIHNKLRLICIECHSIHKPYVGLDLEEEE